MPTVLNNREWATLIWLSVLLAFALTNADVRAAFGNFFRTLAAPILLKSLLLMAAYVAAAVYAAYPLGAWDLDLMGATAVWFLTSAVGVWNTITNVACDAQYLRKAVKRAVAVTILFEALVNLYVFPLGVELVLVPFLTIVAAMSALVGLEPEFEILRRPLGAILSMGGLVIVIFAVVEAITDLSNGQASHLLKAVALPVWLGLALLPFIYGFGLYVVYQTAFVRLAMAFNATPAAIRRARLALLLGVRAKPYYLGTFAEPWPKRLNAAVSHKDARRVVAELCADRDSG
jgi:hypothetical protein